MTIGYKIKEIRLQQGLTQRQLGEKCGILEPNIRKYELGKANPKFETLQKIATALGVPVSIFFNIKENGYTDYDLTSLSTKKQINTVLSDVLKSKNITIDNTTTKESDASVQFHLLHDELTLLDNYIKLNKLGKNEAQKRVQELTEIPKYINKAPTT